MEIDIMNTVIFKELVIHTPEKDILKLCRVNKQFNLICKQNRNFLKKEMEKRKVFVTIESDPDITPGDYIHEITLSKTKPQKMFSDFIETYQLELINYNAKNVYVVFKFEGGLQPGYVTDIEIFTDFRKAKAYFDKKVSNEVDNLIINKKDALNFNETKDNIQSVISFYEENNLHSRWQLIKLKQN